MGKRQDRIQKDDEGYIWSQTSDHLGVYHSTEKQDNLNPEDFVL